MVAYTHLMEFLPERESRVSGAFMCFDGLLFFLSPLFLQYVSNDMNLMFAASFAFNAMAVLLFLVQRVPESLKFLLTKGRYEQFWQEYDKIEARNGGGEEAALERRRKVEMMVRQF